MYSRKRDSFEGVFRVGECMTDANEDARRRVGVEGGFEGTRAIDATLEIICEICARSPDAPWDDAGVEAELGWCCERREDLRLTGSNVAVDGG